MHVDWTISPFDTFFGLTFYKGKDVDWTIGSNDDSTSGLYFVLFVKQFF